MAVLQKAMKTVIKYYEQFKPKVKKQSNGRFSFLKIPIFATHTREDDTPMHVDADWMKRCVADQKELRDKFKRLPKVGVGHNEDPSAPEKEAVFYLDNYTFEPKTGFLYADYVDVPEAMKDELLANKWPNRSCEPSVDIPRIEYMALLGGRPGWLKALPDIHYAEGKPKFKEILMPNPKTKLKYAELSEDIKQAIQSAVKESLDGLLSELGADGVSGAAEPYEEGQDEVTKQKAEAQTQADNGTPDPDKEEGAFAEEPTEGNPDAANKPKPQRDAGDEGKADPDEDDESEDSLREKLMKNSERQYKEMSKDQLKAMWGKVSGAGEDKNGKGRYNKSNMKNNWGESDEYADKGKKGQYAEVLQRNSELEKQVADLKKWQRDQDRASERHSWHARYAELHVPPARLDPVKQVDHIMKLPKELREDHFKAIAEALGGPSVDPINQGNAFSTYSESAHGAGTGSDESAKCDEFIRQNLARFGGDVIAAGRAFYDKRS